MEALTLYGCLIILLMNSTLFPFTLCLIIFLSCITILNWFFYFKCEGVHWGGNWSLASSENVVTLNPSSHMLVVVPEFSSRSDGSSQLFLVPTILYILSKDVLLQCSLFILQCLTLKFVLESLWAKFFQESFFIGLGKP